MSERTLIDEVIERDVSLLEYYGIDVVSHGDGACRLSAVPKSEIVNSLGFAHGSLAFTLADTAAAYAMASAGLHGATINAGLAFTKPMKAGVEAIADAAIETSGKTLATIRATVTSDGKIVAHGTLQFYVFGNDAG